MNPTLVLLLVPLVAAVPAAQDPASTPKRPSDPTAIDSGLLRALAQPDSGRNAGNAATAMPFPSVAIRGVVVPRRGEPLAVLEVDSARVRVKVGTVVPLANGDRLRVDQIGVGEVVLFRESTGETRGVR